MDEDRLRVRVDVADHTGREHDLLAEDPRPGVDDDEAAARFVGRLVDLSDAAVTGLDAEPGHVDIGRRRDRGSPDVGSRHEDTSVVGVSFRLPGSD